MNNVLYKTCKKTSIYNKKKRLNDLIRSRMEGYWTDKLLYYTHNKTSYPWLVNNRYKLCYSMPNYCYSKTNKEYGLHKVHAPDNLSDVLQVYIAILPIDNNTYITSGEIMFMACKKTQFPREARRFLRIQQ